MGDYDLAAKAVLRELPADLLRRGLGLGPLRRVAPVDKELAPTPRTTDGLLAVVPRRGAPFLLVVEVEHEPRHDSVDRALFGWARAQDQERRAARRSRRRPRDALVLIVYLRRGRRRGRARDAACFDLGGGQRVECQFATLCLWDLDGPAQAASGEVGLLPFVPAADGARTP